MLLQRIKNILKGFLRKKVVYDVECEVCGCYMIATFYSTVDNGKHVCARCRMLEAKDV